MKHTTRKQAVITITIRLNDDREDFFLYDAMNYSSIVQAIEHAQRNELALKTLKTGVN